MFQFFVKTHVLYCAGAAGFISRRQAGFVAFYQPDNQPAGARPTGVHFSPARC